MADMLDPVSNAVTSPEASLFLRQILQAAVQNPASALADWSFAAHALLANLMMNDDLNMWNLRSGKVDRNIAQEHVDQAMKSTDKQVLALANHAQGLIHRAKGDHDAAKAAFKKAVELGPNFARAQAQIANQEILCKNPENAHSSIDQVIRENPHHPASGYFYWAKGRAYVEESLSNRGKVSWKEAITAFVEAEKRLSDVWYIYAYKAYAFWRDNRRQDAVNTLTALKNDRRFQDALSTLDPAPGATVGNWLRNWLLTGDLPEPHP